MLFALVLRGERGGAVGGASVGGGGVGGAGRDVARDKRHAAILAGDARAEEEALEALDEMRCSEAVHGRLRLLEHRGRVGVEHRRVRVVQMRLGEVLEADPAHAVVL
jgi:hypothetical protein